MKNAAFYKKRWFRLGTISMLLLGFGVSLIGEAIALKSNGGSVVEWVILGTFAIAVFNAGVCVFGECVICKVKYNDLKEKE